MNRLLLATTFRLTDLEKSTYYLKKWKEQDNLHIVALILGSEVESNPTAARLLGRFVDKVIAYENDETGKHYKATTKTSPNIKTVLEILSAEEGYDYYGFANADIEADYGHIPTGFSESIHKLSQGALAVFAHRRDYSSDKNTYKVYTKGFDLFMLPAGLIKNASLCPGLKFFQIGQVGWDYMLPLSLREQDVATTSLLPIFHKEHKTGSNSDWSQAIITCITYIDPTWTYHKPIKRLVLKITSRLIKPPSSNKNFNAMWKRLKQPLYYVTSRVIYYGIIEKLFLKQKQ